jgi:hypothetical protein
MNTQLLRRVRALRAMNPFVPMAISAAVQQARSELNPDLGGYDFLAELDTYNGSVTGTIGAFEVKVIVEDDYDAQLGEDDVSGTFGDVEQDGAILNTTHGSNGSDYKYYYPANFRATEDGMPWAEGLSRSRLAEYYRWVIEDDMADDANRRYLDVSVEISLDGQQLGSASLHAIDVVDKYPAEPYLIEVAIENIGEALDEVRRNATKLVEDALNHAQKVIVAVVEMKKS